MVRRRNKVIRKSQRRERQDGAKQAQPNNPQGQRRYVFFLLILHGLCSEQMNRFSQACLLLRYVSLLAS